MCPLTFPVIIRRAFPLSLMNGLGTISGLSIDQSASMTSNSSLPLWTAMLSISLTSTLSNSDEPSL